MLEREQETPALRVELSQLARRVGAKARARVGQRLAHTVARVRHVGQPAQRLGDVRVLETRRGKLFRHAIAVVGDFGLLAVLEQKDQDVVHGAPFL